MIKTSAAIILALAACLVACKSGEVTNVSETYTVTTLLWKHTNVIEISQCSPYCELIRYVEKGVTNEFHSFGMPVHIETNKPAPKTTWHLEFKNGVDGPSGVCELSADGGRILRTLSVGKSVEVTNEVKTYTVTVMGHKYTNVVLYYGTPEGFNAAGIPVVLETNSMKIGMAGPTHVIEVRDPEGQLLLTIDGIPGLKRPKNAGEVVITLWEADGAKYESAWFLPYFPETNELWRGHVPYYYGTNTTTGYATNNQKELFNWHDASRPSNWYDWMQIVVTNWVSIGTYTTKTGASEDVQRGNIVTNTTAILEWKGKRHELLLESVNGPDCGERRMPIVNQWLQYWKTITNSPWIGVLTNLYIDHIESTNALQWIRVETNSNYNL